MVILTMVFVSMKVMRNTTAPSLGTVVQHGMQLLLSLPEKLLLKLHMPLLQGQTLQRHVDAAAAIHLLHHLLRHRHMIMQIGVVVHLTQRQVEWLLIGFQWDVMGMEFLQIQSVGGLNQTLPLALGFGARQVLQLKVGQPEWTLAQKKLVLPWKSRS